MYDAIIVGARCAGSPLAMLLARKGYKVLVLDRSTFPSDIISGHYIQPAGVARLKKWGLLDRIAGTSAPPLAVNNFDLGPFKLTGTPPPIDGVSEGYCIRRYILDKILVDTAAEAGAEIREAFTVTEVLFDNGRVTGVRGRGQDGKTVSEFARIVVGADGPRSFVARAVKAPSYNEAPTLTCGYYTYWADVQINSVELYPRKDRFIIALPTNDGLTQVAVIWRHDEFAAYRSDIENNYLRTLDELTPDLASRVRSGRRAERFLGTAEMQNFFRRAHGPGWALAGDAGYHKDPITAQGITDAFRDAEYLAEALDAGFAEVCPVDKALETYEGRRNAAVMPMYEMTCQLAAMDEPPPAIQELFGALRGNRYQTSRFFGLMAGSVAIPDFYSPENIGRIMSEDVSYALAA